MGSTLNALALSSTKRITFFFSYNQLNEFFVIQAKFSSNVMATINPHFVKLSLQLAKNCWMLDHFVFKNGFL